MMGYRPPSQDSGGMLLEWTHGRPTDGLADRAPDKKDSQATRQMRLRDRPTDRPTSTVFQFYQSRC